MPDGCELTDWKAACQDQTDLLNAANGKVRALESRLANKGESHRQELLALRERIRALEIQVADVTNGQGTVTEAAHLELSGKLGKTIEKLRATQQFAERQRKLNVRWREAAIESMGSNTKLVGLIVDTTQPVVPVPVTTPLTTPLVPAPQSSLASITEAPF